MNCGDAHIPRAAWNRFRDLLPSVLRLFSSEFGARIVSMDDEDLVHFSLVDETPPPPFHLPRRIGGLGWDWFTRKDTDEPQFGIAVACAVLVLHEQIEASMPGSMTISAGWRTRPTCLSEWWSAAHLLEAHGLLSGPAAQKGMCTVLIGGQGQFRTPDRPPRESILQAMAGRCDAYLAWALSGSGLRKTREYDGGAEEARIILAAKRVCRALRRNVDRARQERVRVSIVVPKLVSIWVDVKLRCVDGAEH